MPEVSALDPELKQRIDGLIGSDRVVLFMKGSRNFPQCGFSATVAQILNGLLPSYATVNVLTDAGLRDGIKAYSQWPTIPQLYIDGKFIGGCDIVREMFQAGELHALLGVSRAPSVEPAQGQAQAPKLSVSDAAKRAITEARGNETGHLRLEVSPDFEHGLSIDEATPGDFQVDLGGFTVLVDEKSAARADGVRIDFATEQGGGFVIENPNEPPKVRQLSATGLKTLMASGERFELFDVRTDEERRTASIPGARKLEDDSAREIEGMDKNTALVFHCHHGGRSQAAAERFVKFGFRRVFNLAGGIDAWSKQVDPTVPRY
jgi:monothiol glutaredoxin